MGITEAKQAIKRTNHTLRPKKRRTTPFEELSLTRQKEVTNQQRRARLIEQGLTPEQAKVRMRQETRAATAEARLAAAHGNGPRLTAWTAPQDASQRAHQFQRRGAEARPAGIRPVPGPRGAFRPTRKNKIRAPAGAHLNDDMLSAFTVNAHQCAYKGCGNPATTTPTFCTHGDPRCAEHKDIACRGPHGWIACSCMVTKTGSTHNSGGNARPHRRKRRRRMRNTCYEVDIGDTVVMQDANDGEVRGTVAHVIWNGEGDGESPMPSKSKVVTGSSGQRAWGPNGQLCMSMMRDRGQQRGSGTMKTKRVLS